MAAQQKSVDEFEPKLERTQDDDDAEAAISKSGQLAVYDSRAPRLHMGEPAYKQFSKEMLALVAKTIMPDDYTLPELYMGLEVAATYGLDVFTKELWLVRMKQGGPVTPLVGRDGLLAIAERHKDFKGFRNAEVYENDDFRHHSDPRQTADGSFTHVEHSFSLTNRGKLIGAWAEVYRDGRPPVFFYAPLAEYERDGNTPWRKQRTAMIRKCALANALRLAYRISGLYIADEMTGTLLDRVTEAKMTEAGEVGVSVEDPVQREWLERLFRTLNDLKAGSYLPAKQRLLTAGKEPGELAELVAQLEQEILDNGGTPPPQPTPRETEVEEAEEEAVVGEVLDDREPVQPAAAVCEHPTDAIDELEDGERFCTQCNSFIGPAVADGQETLEL